MLELNAKTTALVVIDLQEGILPFAGGPHTADEVVNRAGKLADYCIHKHHCRKLTAGENVVSDR